MNLQEQQFADWLTTVPNANGNFYLATVAKRYATCLRTSPPKLNLALLLYSRNVYACHTINEFEGLLQLFKSAQNFKEVNEHSGHGAFSAALSCYARYLKETENNERRTHIPMSEQTNGNLQLVDFSKPELCAFTDPYECTIGSHLLFGAKERGKNWRDLFVLVCEHFITNSKEKIMSCQLQSGRQLLTKDRPANCVCRQLSNGYFLVVSVDIPNLVRFIGKICNHCGMTIEDVKISYVPKGVNSADAPIQHSTSLKPASEPTPQPLEDIVDAEEGIAGICEILNTHFQSLYGYSNAHILWDAAKSSLSMFLNDNAINVEDDLWRFMARALNAEYVLYQPHIWKTAPDYPQSARGLIVNLARQHSGTVTREQINEFFSRIKIATQYNAQVLQQELLLFYEHDKFILTETVDPSSSRCVAITKALDRLFAVEDEHYVVLRDIASTWFSHLPEIKAGLRWTPLLLQEVIRIRPNNIGYRIIMSGLGGQAYDTLGAAITPKKSEVQTFSDVVHRYCHTKQYFGKRVNAEELRLELREAGMLDGNELIYNLHKVLDYRFAFDHGNETIKILER